MTAASWSTGCPFCVIRAKEMSAHEAFVFGAGLGLTIHVPNFEIIRILVCQEHESEFETSKTASATKVTAVNQERASRLAERADAEGRTLGDALPIEVARVRDQILPLYAGNTLAGAVLRALLDRAAKAMIAGDTIEMIRVYDQMKSIKA